MHGWTVHFVSFVVGQGISVLLGQSRIAGVSFGGADADASSPTPLPGGREPESLPLLANLGRLWCIVFAVDTVWSLFSEMSPRKKERR